VSRLCVAFLAVVCVFVQAPTGAAQRDDSPTKLWSEYPLEPKTREATPAPTASLPTAPRPSDAVQTPVTDRRPKWILWLVVAAAGAVGLFAVTRPLATPRSQTVARSARRLASRAGRLNAHVRGARPNLRLPPRPRGRAPARRHRRANARQYAPESVVTTPSAPPDSVPYVTRRSGLVLSRYVVLVEESGHTHELRRSRRIWQVGREEWRDRAAEDAWDKLANDLRADGWEVDATGRYEYFVPLRRALVSTLEPYTSHGGEVCAGLEGSTRGRS
jgi:hypothetical protein